MKRSTSTLHRRTRRFALGCLLASCAATPCSLIACDEPPAITAGVPPSPSAMPPPAAASTPPPASSAPPKSLAAIIGRDEAAALMESHGVPVVTTRTAASGPAHMPCIAAATADAGDPIDASPLSDAGTSKALAHASWNPPSPPPSIAHDPAFTARTAPANQRPLAAAAVPFATWLNSVHVRVHPIWAESYLDSLALLSCDDKKNDPRLFTSVELVVEGKTGRLAHVGVRRSSGVDDFDVAAVASFMRAAPFGVPPPAIWSTDGNVYFLWEVHRDEAYACSTMNARPYLLNLPTTP